MTTGSAAPSSPKPKRHRWGDKVRLVHKTEQECLDCGLIKVGRHEWEGGDVYWTEWWRDMEQIRCKGTPPCEPELKGAQS